MNNRKLAILGLALLLISLLTPVSHAGSQAEQPPQTLAGEDFTHNVLLELFVTTWCQYCPATEEAAVEYSNAYGERFVFVSMVCDPDEGGNEKAEERSQRYSVNSYPTAIFDGDYREDRSGSTEYEDEIEECGEREPVAAVDLEVDMVDNGDGTMDVSYATTYHSDNPLMPVFQAHLRVYIVEKVSRYPNNQGHQIPYGFIDFAFDEDMDMASEAEMTDTVTWRFDDHENASFDNFVVIGAVFDRHTEPNERYVVQSATTEKSSVLFENIDWDPEYPKNSDDVTVWADVTGDFQDVQLEYAICTQDSCGANQYVDMELESGDTYTATMGDFGSDAVSVHFKIVASTSGGGEIKSELTELEFGLSPSGDGGSDGDDENFAQDPGKMGWVGLGVLLLVPLAVYFVDSKFEDEDEDWDDDDEYYDHSQDPVEYDPNYPGMSYDETSYSDDDYSESWDQQLR